MKSATEVKKAGPHLLMAADAKCMEETTNLLLSWPNVKNILDLVQVCKHMQLFYGDKEQEQLSVLRCETCYQYKNKAKSSLPSNPVNTAKKGVAG